MQLNIRRRGFLFGAAATLVVPPPRTFHLMPRSAFDIAALRSIRENLAMATGIPERILFPPFDEEGFLDRYLAFVAATSPRTGRLVA